MTLNDAESNPYAVCSGILQSGRAQRTPILQSLALAIIFTLSFFFLGAAIMSGVAFAWRYTLEMIADFWFLVGQMFLFHAVLQWAFLPSMRVKHFLLPMLAGIAATLGFNFCHDHFSPFEEYFSVVWIDLMALVPAALGVLLQVIIFAIVVAVTRQESAVRS